MRDGCIYDEEVAKAAPGSRRIAKSPRLYQKGRRGCAQKQRYEYDGIPVMLLRLSSTGAPQPVVSVRERVTCEEGNEGGNVW